MGENRDFVSRFGGNYAHMTKLFIIGAFGAAGAICRHLTGATCIRLFGDQFAYGTLAVNVVGCFLLGLLMHLWGADSLKIHPHAHAGITAGFLGALTTFSTFGYETIRHVEESEWLLAGMNVAGNLVLGLAAAAGGVLVGRMIG